MKKKKEKPVNDQENIRRVKARVDSWLREVNAFNSN